MCQTVAGTVLTIPSLVDDVLILLMRKVRLAKVEGFVPGHLKANARLVAIHFGKWSGRSSKGLTQSYQMTQKFDS